jgi:RNAse (barnase) inhibitor barstar
MKKFLFINNSKLFSDLNSFVVHLDNINSEDALFEKLYIKLIFPDYFGFNWNAVYDCLRDFYWIKQQKIIIVHDDFPKINKQVLKLYLDVLIDAMNDWKEDEEHSLDIIFPKQYEQEIASLLKDNCQVS